MTDNNSINNNRDNDEQHPKTTFSKVWIIFGMFFAGILAIIGVIIFTDKSNDSNAPYVLWGFSFALFVFTLGTGKIIELLEIIVNQNNKNI